MSNIVLRDASASKNAHILSRCPSLPAENMAYDDDGSGPQTTAAFVLVLISSEKEEYPMNFK